MFTQLREQTFQTLSALALACAALTTSIGIPTAYCADEPCPAQIWLCSNGPGIFVDIIDTCRPFSQNRVFLLGYRKSGVLGKRANVNATVMIHSSLGISRPYNLQLTPDWRNKGFLSAVSEDAAYWLNVGTSYAGTGISVAYSNDENQWDSRSGRNYYFPVMGYPSDSAKCVKHTSSNRLTSGKISDIPADAWDFIFSIF